VTARDRLERIAAKQGWRLAWRSAPLGAAPNLICTELDIYQGRRMVTRDGPVFVMHGGNVDAFAIVAQMVLDALPRRGPRQP
jgi:hypothetical protein